MDICLYDHRRKRSIMALGVLNLSLDWKPVTMETANLLGRIIVVTHAERLRSLKDGRPDLPVLRLWKKNRLES